jgi:hypothetical protein
VGKLAVKRQPGTYMHRWENNIKMDVKEVEWEETWIGFIWFRIRTGGRCL